jgi:hypothetical protein
VSGPTSSRDKGLLALLLSLFLLIGMPLVYLVAPLFVRAILGSREIEQAIYVLVPIGTVLWITALVLSIVAMAKSSSKTMPVIALVLTVLSIGTGAAGWFLGLVIAAGGGPR